jgi:hypothetical protein
MRAATRTWLVLISLLLPLGACEKKAAEQTKPVATPAAKPAPAAKPTPPKVQQPSGVTVSSEEAGFSVTFPPGFQNPNKKTTPVPTAVGVVKMHMYSSSKANGEFAAVAFNEYPDAVFEKQTMASLLDGAVNGALKNTGGKLDKQVDHAKGERPARTFYYTVQKGRRTGYGRQYLLGLKPRLYQIIFISSTKGRPTAPDIETFFGCELTPRPGQRSTGRLA